MSKVNSVIETDIIIDEKAIAKAKKKAHNRFLYRYSPTAYFMLLPAFILLSVFVMVPLLMAVVRSFQDYQTGAFVGLSNFKYIITTPQFTKACLNVVIFAGIITVLMVVFSFMFAVALKCLSNKLSNIARIVIYIPFFISGIVASIIFQLLINYGGGLFTSLLIGFGAEPISFATDGFWPYVSIIVPTIWLGFGYNALVMYAGILNIPKEYYEAANIDGAGDWKKLIHITIPNMRNYFVLIVINLVTANMQMMEIPYMITGGGPLNSTMTPVLYLFNSFRDPSRPENVTTAGALLIMIFIMFLNMIVFRVVRSEKSADA